ncbi:hypothetical protein RKD46_003145 [Streptomyces pseudovenezuelae]
MGLRHLRHEVRGRGPAADRGDPPGAQPRPHLHLLRQRRGRGPPQRPGTCGRGPSRVAGGRLRGPPGADGQPGRGRLPGNPAGPADVQGGAGALRARVDGVQRDPQGRPRPRQARRLRTAQAGGGRTGVPRGAQRRARGGRRGHERHPRLLHADGQLPLRAGPQRGRGGGLRTGLLRGLRGRRVHRRRPHRRRPPRSHPPRRPGLHGRGRRRRPAPSSAGRTCPASARWACPR